MSPEVDDAVTLCVTVTAAASYSFAVISVSDSYTHTLTPRSPSTATGKLGIERKIKTNFAFYSLAALAYRKLRPKSFFGRELSNQYRKAASAGGDLSDILATQT